MIPMIPVTLPVPIAHYTAYNGRKLLALIIEQVEAGQADLAVFTNMQNAAGKKNFGIQFHQEVEYSMEPKPGTWCFYGE